jgi:hypothetical protein
MKCTISVDLDGIGCYYRIHGLGTPPVELEHLIHERALPRAAALFRRRGVRVTWFVVGRDADGDAALPDRAVRAANGARLKLLVEAGDELANHSYSHPYAMARMEPLDIEAEVAGADRVLRGIAGSVRGFRAPGYDVSPAMLDALARRGYHYDSSIFPAPAYYAAKAGVIAVLAAIRRPSGAVLTNPRALAAPAEPYRPAMTAPWRHGQAPLVGLPVAVTPRCLSRRRACASGCSRPWRRGRCSISSCTASILPTPKRTASLASSLRGSQICACRSPRSSPGSRLCSTRSHSRRNS